MCKRYQQNLKFGHFTLFCRGRQRKEKRGRRRQRKRHFKIQFLVIIALSRLFQFAQLVKTTQELNFHERRLSKGKERKFAIMCSRPRQNLKFGHLTLIFCRGRQRNVPKCKKHVQRDCFVTFSLTFSFSFSNDDGDGNEKVVLKYNCWFLYFFRDYSNLFTFENAGELCSVYITTNGVKGREKKQKFNVMHSRSRENLKFGHYTLFCSRR